MMHERQCIRALAQSARVSAAQNMRHDAINETDKRMSHAEARAILFAHTLSQPIYRTRVSESF